MKKSTVIGTVVVLSAIGTAICLALMPTTTLEVPSAASHQFTIDESMPVSESAIKTLKQQEQVIRDVVAEHADELFVLPESGNSP